MDCLVFRAESAYGQFRKPYTTTSALTFSCIHPVAARGLVGAILGIDRSELYKSTANMRVGIRVLSPVRKDMQSVKLITMKSEKLFHFPANIEFLRDIVYELYVMWDSNKLDELETRLKDRTPVYTPCVGVTEHVAKLDFICRCDAVNIQKVDRVDSIIPVRFVNNIVFENCDIFMDNIPITNNKKREYIAYEKVMFAFSGDKNCKIIGDIYGDMFKIGDKNIYLF